MNEYLKNLNKIEFVVTNACTGRCKHCSEGDHHLSGCSIDPKIASDAVRAVASKYDIKTVMTFGGEPLLCAETVFAIMRTAYELNIPKRQVITNGYFSKSESKIYQISESLADCGVNDLLLSVDAFHQESIPLDTVRLFAQQVKNCGVPIRLQPAWLIAPDHRNPYNDKTREILDSFSDIEIFENEGNIVFPDGNAKKYLSEYFTEAVCDNPYIEDPKNVKCLSFSPEGDVLNGNVYKQDILDIIQDYAP